MSTKGNYRELAAGNEVIIERYQEEGTVRYVVKDGEGNTRNTDNWEEARAAAIDLGADDVEEEGEQFYEWLDIFS